MSFPSLMFYIRSFAVDLKQVRHSLYCSVECCLSNQLTLTAFPDAQRPEMSPGGMGQEH